MAKKKYDLITELYAETIKEVSSSPQKWLSFLESACRNFRLPFDEQILVYAQRPQASAVLPMKMWNEKFGRWVKRDSKGIAVLDKNSSTMKLKYYYDISDTQEGRYRRLLRPVPLWEVTEAYREDVKETLANAFGIDEKIIGFEETVLEAAKNAAEDNIPDYLPDLLEGRRESYLEELDEYNVEMESRQILSASVAYMVMVRCGVDMEDYLENEDFQRITNFNTPEMMNLLGVAVSDISEMALSYVSDTIQKLRKAEKENARTFAKTENNRYNEGENREQIIERGGTYERNHIQQTGRLSTSGSDRTGRTGRTPWEVRFPASDLSERTEIRGIPEPADNRKIEPASYGNTVSGTGEDGSPDRTDDESTGHNGETQSQQSDDVGTEREQYPAGGRGNRDEGTDLQLTERPTETQLEWYDRSKEDKSLPFFHKDDDIKALLLATPHLKATKAEIRQFYETHEDKKERKYF